MADEACIRAILEAAPHLSRDDAAAIDDAVARHKKEAGARKALGDATSEAIDFARRQGDLAREAALIEKRNAAFNILREKALWSFVTEDKAGARRLSTAMVGSPRGFRGAAASVDRVAKAMEADFEGYLVAKLDQAGLLGIWKRGGEQFDRDVANELARLTEKNAGRETGNKAAAEAAKILHTVQEAVRRAQNDAGAWIGQLPGYITRQAHDQYRIAKAGFERWRDTIGPLLDERTFEGIDNREAFLRGVWTNLASGDHLKPESVGSAKDPAFKGPGNLARRASAERLLHFKDADAWFDYNRVFGTSSLAESVMHGIKRGSQNAALMQRLGTNPEYMFDSIRERLILEAKKRDDLKEIKRLRGDGLLNDYRAISGYNAVSANPTTSAWMAGTRSVLNMASLGGILFSSITDFANAAATLGRSGVNPLRAYTEEMAAFAKAGGTPARQALNRMGIGIQAMTGDIINRFDATDGVRGTLAKLQNTFFRLTGIVWETDTMKRGVGTVLASHLADLSGRSFDALPADLRTNLLRYDIDAKAWEALRRTDTRVDAETRLLLPERVADADLRLKLQTYYVNEAGEALNEPGAATQAFLMQGTRPGTPVGEAVRFVAQLKKFPAEFVRSQLGRAVLGRAGAEEPLYQVIRSGQFDVPGVVHLIVANTILGYMAMTAKDLAKGKTPRDPDHWKTWLAAMQQGGGLGIYGDFLFGEYNRFGGGFVETLSGPAVGQVNQFLRAWSMIREGDDPTSTMLNVGKGISPFANLFYTRMALDYLVFYQLAEMANPGALRRMESRVKKEYGQSFIFPPSQAIPYGGGNRIFEGVR